MASNTTVVNSDTLAPSQEERLEEVFTADITMDEALQSRVKMCPHKVRDYETAWKNGSNFPPLLVFERNDVNEKKPLYILLDGWHRLQALRNVEEANNKAKIFQRRRGKRGKLVPQEDEQTRITVRVIQPPMGAPIHHLRWLAGRENIRNGLPLTRKDRLPLFHSYVKSRQHRKGTAFKSYREIAGELSFVSHQTIANWMDKYYPAIARAMGKGEEDGANNGASGTGNSLPAMPNLENREIKLFCIDLLTQAKQSTNERRWDIRQQIALVLAQMETEAPCHDPKEDEDF